MKTGQISILIALWTGLTASSCATTEFGKALDQADAAKGDARRDPASAPLYPEACRRLGTSEREVFSALVRSDLGIAENMAYLEALARAANLDPQTYDTGRVALDLLLTRDHGVPFTRIDRFAKILLGECELVRSGEARDPATSTRNLRNLCGKPDQKRDWSTLEDNFDKLDLRRTILANQNVFDPRTGLLSDPESALAACSRAMSRTGSTSPNVEDAIEGLLLCMDAFSLNLLSYDKTSKRYERDSSGRITARAESSLFRECIESYVKGGAT
jgi:hypothetical protein